MLMSCWLLPFMRENSSDDSSHALTDLGCIGAQLAEDTKWCARQMCQVVVPDVLDNSAEAVEAANKQLKSVHAAQPHHMSYFRPYALRNVNQAILPGLKKAEKSTKGKATQNENFDRALRQGNLGLFAWDEGLKQYQRLVCDWEKVEQAMESHGGGDVFGSWRDWGDIFVLRDAQQTAREQQNAECLQRGSAAVEHFPRTFSIQAFV